MSKCAPGVEEREGTCFTLEQLVKIAYAYNQRWLDESSRGKNIPFKKINITYDKSYLLRELRARLTHICGADEACWIEQNFVKALQDVDISRFTFRPKGPQGRFEWLSTTHIEDIMTQYEKIHPDFMFLGAVPIDFYSLKVLGIRDLRFSDLEARGIRRIGVVYNTDEHYKRGEHWIASYTNLPMKQMYFFDSVGRRPEPRITSFFAKKAKYIMERSRCQLEDIDIKYNNVVHQRGNSECGVYVVNFLIRLLNGESFDQIVQRRMSDREINHCRKTYFRNV